MEPDHALGCQKRVEGGEPGLARLIEQRYPVTFTGQREVVLYRQHASSRRRCSSMKAEMMQ
jgi:hypothetical protein